MGGFAWVTLATNDSYSLGALVLAHSLRRVGTKYDLAVLVTPGVTGAMREKLASVFSLVQEVNVLDSKDEANLALLARPELGITFTKLHCWRLTQYEKCVFVDADTLVIRNCDELFEREELSAAPDVGWPDCFNSGVFVFKPSQQTFASITSFAAAKGSFDGGDQGLLNQYFSDWSHKDISKHLPFIYNMCSTATYSYLPAFKQFGDDVRIIHFIGITKPWLQYFDTVSGQVQPAPGSNHLQPLLQLWWNIFCENVHPQLSPVMAGIAGALAKITLGEARSPEQVAFEEHMRKQSWEQGQIDYMGRDSFENIWKKISETLAVQPQRQPSPPKTVAKPEKSVIKVATAVVAAGDDPAAKSEAAVPPELRQREEQDLISDLPPALAKVILPCADLTFDEKSEETVPSQSTSIDAAVSTVALAPTATVPQLSPMESVATAEKNDNETSTLIAATATTTTDSSVPQTCERLSREAKLDERPSKTDFPETPAAATIVRGGVEVEKLEATSSEVVSDSSPVPIQVAESVLEAEVKESVTEDLKPVTEEVISSISVSAQESVPAVLETAMEAMGPATPTPNGSTGTEIGNGIDALNLSSLPSVISPASAVAEIAPDVVTSLQTREVTTAVQSEETCPLSVRSVESIPEVVPVEQMEETCPFPVRSVESIPEAAPADRKEEICPLLVKPVESVSVVEQKQESCPLPVKPVESVPEVAPVEQKQETCPLPVKAVESVPEAAPVEQKQETCPLLVEQLEKSEEVKLLAEAAQAKPREVKLPAETEQPTSLPVKAEKPILPSAVTESPIKSEPIVCPIKPGRNVPESELPERSQELSSLPVAATVVESEDDVASASEESVERKVPKDESNDAEVALEETASQSESSEESPLRPARTKDIQIPGTPIVTEATPPTSPPIGAVESFPEQPTKVTKKVVKKVVKKTTTSETKPTEGSEADADGKKVTKKVVKKVVKKAKDDDPSAVESSSGSEKPKKIVKVVKKTTKTTQSLETDTTVPETPPPGTSDIPVPPKRKLKAAAKTTPAKTDSEP